MKELQIEDSGTDGRIEKVNATPILKDFLIYFDPFPLPVIA
jgi:hypothetical protein